VQDAAATLAEIVIAGSTQTPNPFNTLFQDEEACAAIIDRRPDLLALLKVANDTKDYSAVNSYPAIQRTENKDKLQRRVQAIRPLLAAFIEGGEPFGPWTPVRDPNVKCHPDVLSHIRSLQIPDIGQPAVLIDRLGRFSEEARLEKRVEGIFTKGAKTFLVNTSGTGKTRLSFEGLCRHWGMYFTLARDTNALGSRDCSNLPSQLNALQPLPPSYSLDYWKILDKNIKAVDKKFSIVLLGRLLIFHLYSEIIQSIGILEEHKKRWLLFQLRPSLTGDPKSSSDIFSEICLGGIGLTQEEIDDLIAVLFAKLRKIYGSEFHLFFVLDEAQVISDPENFAFQRENETYSLLEEAIRALGAKSPSDELSFVVAGTDIPTFGFTNAPFAASLRWSSDTGGFDDEAEHRRYVSRFLTPSYVASPAGQMFLNRMWAWGRGRHRVTDAILKALLRDGFQTPHRLLTDFIERTATYRPTDYSDDEEPFLGIPRLSTRVWLNLYLADLVRSQVQEIAFHYLASSETPPPFLGDPTELVNAGIGRFADKHLTKITMNEPLPVIQNAQVFCRRPLENSVSASTPSWLENSYAALTKTQYDATPRSHAAFLAFYLARAFQEESKLSRIFSFHRDKVPTWGDQKAELVGFVKAGGPLTPYDGSGSLLTNASTLNEVDSWLNGLEGVHTPFCLTHTSDPDLLFALRLPDGKFIRVILRAVVTDTILRHASLREIARQLEDDRLLRNEVGLLSSVWSFILS
ncbi:hypothetical protein R3P38DRAFT_2539057, partial [Favolaschia claudopus]